jgi:hypothetical protein
MENSNYSLTIPLFVLLILSALSLPAQEINECSDDLYRKDKRTWLCIAFYESGLDDYLLQRIQSDLGAGKDANDHNFSFNGHSMKGVKRWIGLEKKNWSESKVDLTFFSNENGFVMLSFIDHSGKNLITHQKSKKMIRRYISERICEISYVKAKDGVSLRSGPSFKAPVMQKLNFGEKVLIIGGTKKFSQIKEDGRTIKSEWIKIRAEGIDSAYVNDIYLIQKNEIPPQFLGNYGGVSYHNFLTGQEFGTHLDNTPISSERWNAYKDSIGEFITLSLVDIRLYEKKKIANPYTVDTTDITRKVLPEPRLFNSFYLPTNAGKDSIHIHDIKSEVLTSAFFIGQLKSLNKYVVRYYYESPSHVLYDKITGEQKRFTDGVPYVSPDGKYVIDFYKGWSYPDVSTRGWQDDEDPIIEWCQLSVSALQPNLEFSEVFSVEFDYWIPVEIPNSAFWVSDRELIMKAVAITNKAARKKNERRVETTGL